MREGTHAFSQDRMQCEALH